jgi:NAD(P)-dependent dehydrogenase (short-subunit alcohol dehydrogenase family)
MSLEGKAAIVTGGARGIGLATCQRLAAQGMRVLAFDLADAPFDEVAECATPFRGDVTSDADWAGAVAAAGEGLHLVFNNAGIAGPIGPLLDYDLDAFERVMAVNVRGVFLGIQNGGRAMRKTGGCIVNTSSISGLGGGRFIIAYNASKHAVIGLTRAAAKELATFNIRVNAVCPSPTDTDMIRQAEARFDGQEAAQRALTAGVPLGRYGKPEEVAALVAFLASEEAAFITGVALPIDGGVTA